MSFKKAVHKKFLSSITENLQNFHFFIKKNLQNFPLFLSKTANTRQGVCKH